ncbi:CLUMA_CG005676, isoform A [Clunio marinus]|uniref:CLUMA_CG005676, isoform A n=1 Tax=Clunio marinus TaxID=568069 RepID=A0A1J1I159_9DIPT|nr:CLUMA_CG005676, isoform A [Clunio marinus]
MSQYQQRMMTNKRKMTKKNFEEGAKWKSIIRYGGIEIILSPVAIRILFVKTLQAKLTSCFVQMEKQECDSLDIYVDLFHRLLLYFKSSQLMEVCKKLEMEIYATNLVLRLLFMVIQTEIISIHNVNRLFNSLTFLGLECVQISSKEVVEVFLKLLQFKPNIRFKGFCLIKLHVIEKEEKFIKHLGYFPMKQMMISPQKPTINLNLANYYLCLKQ